MHTYVYHANEIAVYGWSVFPNSCRRLKYISSCIIFWFWLFRQTNYSFTVLDIWCVNVWRNSFSVLTFPIPWQPIALPHVSHINDQFNEHFIILLTKHNLHYNSNIMHPLYTRHIHFIMEIKGSACICMYVCIVYTDEWVQAHTKCEDKNTNNFSIYDASGCFKWFLMWRLMSSKRINFVFSSNR